MGVIWIRQRLESSKDRFSNAITGENSYEMALAA